MKNKNKKKMSGYERRERVVGLLFIAPICLKVLIFTFGFMIYSLYMSFSDWSILKGTNAFIGLVNYKDILSDPIFWKAIGNTVYLMLGIPIGMVIAFFMAMALNRSMPCKKLFRTFIYLPHVTSAIAIVVLWRFLYNSEYGLFNILIERLTGSAGPDWLGDPGMVKISLIIMGVWRGVGDTMLLFLAGLQNVPKDYYEVMDIEGGNFLHKLRYVTLPMLSPVVFYMIITKVIGSLQAFSDQFVMTGVGPEYSAITIVYYLWQKGFSEYNMGAACSVAWVVATMIFIITLIQFKFSNKWVYEE